MKRKSLRRFKKSEMHLEINSLLDILVILLVFLIKNFSATHIDLPIPKELVVPVSKSVEQNQDSITVALTKDLDIYVNKKIVDRLDTRSDESNVASLYSELLGERERIQNSFISSGVNISSIVNVVIDENVNYKHIRKILYTLKEAKFKEYKFITTQ